MREQNSQKCSGQLGAAGRITASAEKSLSKMNSPFFCRSYAETESLHVLLLPAGSKTTCALDGGEADEEQSRTKAAVTFFFLYILVHQVVCLELVK